MNKTGQYAIVGGIIMAFIAIIIGLSLLSPTVSNAVHSMTATETTATNLVVSTAGVTTTLTGKHTTDFVAVNASGAGAANAADYTVNNEVILADGTIGSTVLWKTSTATDNFTTGAGAKVNVTYTYQPLGYLPDAGSRGIASVIIIFLAIAIFVIALVPALRNDVIGMVKDYI